MKTTQKLMYVFVVVVCANMVALSMVAGAKPTVSRTVSNPVPDTINDARLTATITQTINLGIYDQLQTSDEDRYGVAWSEDFTQTTAELYNLEVTDGVLGLTDQSGICTPNVTADQVFVDAGETFQLSLKYFVADTGLASGIVSFYVASDLTPDAELLMIDFYLIDDNSTFAIEMNGEYTNNYVAVTDKISSIKGEWIAVDILDIRKMMPSKSLFADPNTPFYFSPEGILFSTVEGSAEVLFDDIVLTRSAVFRPTEYTVTYPTTSPKYNQKINAYQFVSTIEMKIKDIYFDFNDPVEGIDNAIMGEYLVSDLFVTLSNFVSIVDANNVELYVQNKIDTINVTDLVKSGEFTITPNHDGTHIIRGTFVSSPQIIYDANKVQTLKHVCNALYSASGVTKDGNEFQASSNAVKSLPNLNFVLEIVVQEEGSWYIVTIVASAIGAFLGIGMVTRFKKRKCGAGQYFDTTENICKFLSIIMIVVFSVGILTGIPIVPLGSNSVSSMTLNSGMSGDIQALSTVDSMIAPRSAGIYDRKTDYSTSNGMSCDVDYTKINDGFVSISARVRTGTWAKWITSVTFLVYDPNENEIHRTEVSWSSGSKIGSWDKSVTLYDSNNYGGEYRVWIRASAYFPWYGSTQGNFYKAIPQGADDDTKVPTITFPNLPLDTTRYDNVSGSIQWNAVDNSDANNVASGIYQTEVKGYHNDVEIFSQVYAGGTSGTWNLPVSEFGLGSYKISVKSTDNDIDRGDIDRSATGWVTSKVVIITDNDEISPELNVFNGDTLWEEGVILDFSDDVDTMSISAIASDENFISKVEAIVGSTIYPMETKPQINSDKTLNTPQYMQSYTVSKSDDASYTVGYLGNTQNPTALRSEYRDLASEFGGREGSESFATTLLYRSFVIPELSETDIGMSGVQQYMTSSVSSIVLSLNTYLNEWEVCPELSIFGNSYNLITFDEAEGNNDIVVWYQINDGAWTSNMIDGDSESVDEHDRNWQYSLPVVQAGSTINVKVVHQGEINPYSILWITGRAYKNAIISGLQTTIEYDYQIDARSAIEFPISQEPGTYTFQVNATDNDDQWWGDKSSTIQTYTYTITDDDSEAPIITWDYSGSVKSIDDSDPENIIITAWDNVINAIMTISASDNVGLAVNPSISFATSNIPGTYVFGPYYAEDNDNDRVGDSLSATLSITLIIEDDDVSAPVISEMDYDTTPTNLMDELVITFNVADESDYTIPIVVFDDVEIMATNVIDDTWEAIIPLTSAIDQSIALGDHVFNIIVKDLDLDWIDGSVTDQSVTDIEYAFELSDAVLPTMIIDINVESMLFSSNGIVVEYSVQTTPDVDYRSPRDIVIYENDVLTYTQVGTFTKIFADYGIVDIEVKVTNSLDEIKSATKQIEINESVVLDLLDDEWEKLRQIVYLSPISCWRNGNKNDTAILKINETESMTRATNYTDALAKMYNDLRPKLTSLREGQTGSLYKEGSFKQAWVTCPYLRDLFETRCNVIVSMIRFLQTH